MSDRAPETLQSHGLRFILQVLMRTRHRLSSIGAGHVPISGPVVLVTNHTGPSDGLFVAASAPRAIRFLTACDAPVSRLRAFLMRQMRAVPLPAPAPQIVALIRAELADRQAVCLFADGAVNRVPSGFELADHLGEILAGLDVPIVPVYIDEDWSRPPQSKSVAVAFGPSLPSHTTPAEIRQALTELGPEPLAARRGPRDRMQVEFIRSARRHSARLALADSTGQKLTYGRALITGFALGRAIARRTHGQQAVGTLLPASVGGAVTNIALLMADKIPINLNFTLGQDMLDASVARAGIKTILTSRVFLEKAGLPTMPSMVFLEDLRGTITGTDKVAAVCNARLTPMAIFRRRYLGTTRTTSPLLTTIFSSGSTGVPKGVMLTHASVLVNIDSFAQLFPMSPSDTFIGVLPFFHSFGFTCTLWFPLLRGSAVVYHPNPMEAKIVGELTERYRGTMLVGTATFCGAYVRRCTRDQFSSLRYAIVGAEKLRPALAKEFEERFGLALLEGYGMTEMAPVVAVNRSPATMPKRMIGNRPGSVGCAIPGVAAKIVDRETGAPLGIGEEGLLLVKGPNMMTGYLQEPARTEDVIRDGWYVTGDIAKLDEDGFIFITDRLSRFSKIGGEMVPHLRIEEAINTILGEVACAITAIPDDAKGERLVVFYTTPNLTPEQLWSRLTETDLPRLWIPKRENLVPIDAIPVLGSGKLDLRRLRALALDRATGRATG